MEESAPVLAKKIVLRELWSMQDTLMLAGAISAVFLVVIASLKVYMRNREPYKLKTFIFWYNSLQVFLSILGVGLTLPIFYTYGINSQGCLSDAETQEWYDYYILLQYIYNFYKHLDLMDTVIFTLRKKDNQITFLHVYHHVTMIGWGWIVSLAVHTDHHVVPGIMNSAVHFFMYFYYLMASLGPKYAKYIWWKQHLTKLQLVQFVIIVTHVTYQQLTSSCPVPTFVYLYSITNPIIFFILFMNFYLKSYQKQKKE